MDNLLTVRDISRLTGKDINIVYAMLRYGDVRTSLIGKSIIVKKDEFINFAKAKNIKLIDSELNKLLNNLNNLEIRAGETTGK